MTDTTVDIIQNVLILKNNLMYKNGSKLSDCAVSPSDKALYYSRTSMARTFLGPRKLVRDMVVRATEGEL